MIKLLFGANLIESKGKVLLQVIWQWLSLVAQIIISGVVARTIAVYYEGNLETKKLLSYLGIALFAIFSKAIFELLYSKSVLTVNSQGKTKLRRRLVAKAIYNMKTLKEEYTASNLAKIISRGPEKMESFYCMFMSQFVYTIIAPITLLIFLLQYNVKAAVVFFVVTPLAPILGIAGAALGIAVTISEFLLSNMGLEQALLFLFLSLEFYKPVMKFAKYYISVRDDQKSIKKVMALLGGGKNE